MNEELRGPSFARHDIDCTIDHDLYSKYQQHQSFTQRIFICNRYGQWSECVAANYFKN